MDRTLALEFVRVTEAAALRSGRLLGRGEKDGADQLAVDAMRQTFDTVPISGTVVIGEGEIDEALCFTSVKKWVPAVKLWTSRWIRLKVRI